MSSHKTVDGAGETGNGNDCPEISPLESRIPLSHTYEVFFLHCSLIFVRCSWGMTAAREMERWGFILFA